jgi:hypothetical protein
MKNLSNTFLTLVFLLCSYFSFSQVWPKYYGEPNKYDFSEEIIETYDKGIVMCGNIIDYNNGTNKNGWLIKTDVNGDILWEKIFESDLNRHKINAIEQTNDGGFVICGSIRLVLNQSQPMVIKLNSCGEKEWCKIFSTPEDNPWAQDIKETPSGDIIVLVNQFDEGPEETLHLFKLNSQGNVLWKKPFCSGFVHPEGAIPKGYKVIVTETNEFLISGKVYWEDPWNPGGVKVLRPLFILGDSLGEEKWVLPFGLQDTIYGTADNIFEINSNFLIGTGSYWGDQELVQPLFMKIDLYGNELGYHILNASEIFPEIAGGSFAFSEIEETNLYSGGIFAFTSNLGYPAMEAKFDIDTINFSFSPLLHKIYDENSDPYSFNKTSSNKLLSNSTFKQTGNWDISLSKLNLNLEYDTLDPGNYTYDSLCTTPGLPQSGFIYLDDCDIVTDIPSPKEYYESIRQIPVKAYPNPVSESIITLEYENTEHLSSPYPPQGGTFLAIFNIFGEEMHEEKIYKHQGESIVNVQSWQKGIYFAVVYSNGLPVGKCKFVVW